MPQYGIQAMGMLSVHDHSNLTQGGAVPLGSLSGHNKPPHDALAIDAGQVDGIEGAEILQRDGSVPLTAAWSMGQIVDAVRFLATSGGNINLGEVLDSLRIIRDAAEIVRFLGESNNTCGVKISKAIIGAFELNSLIANNKVPDSDKVDNEHVAAIVTNARVKAHFPDTIANILSNHTKPVHDALKIEGAYLGTPTELTIVGGAITVTGNYHTVDGEGDANDDLHTINGGVDGMELTLRAESIIRDITIQDNVGNIELEGGVNFILDTLQKKIYLFYDATVAGGRWCERSRFSG